jgi:cell division protein FtsA
MMSRAMIVAGLDLGTNHVKCVIGYRHEDGDVHVIGTGAHAARGLQSGKVCNQEDAVNSIRGAIQAAEMMAGCEIAEVFLTVSGRHLRSRPSRGMVRIQGGQVTDEDVRAVVGMAQAIKLHPGYEVLHTIAQDFIIDEQPGNKRPVGMSGVRLEVDAHLVMGNAESTRALEAACEVAGVKVVDVIHAPLAQAEAVLTEQDLEMGVALVDIGGDTTDIAVFSTGSLRHTAFLTLGGEHVTRDIKKVLNLPAAEAEVLKRTHGRVFAEADSQPVEIPGVSGRKARTIERDELCDIIRARVAEILRLVKEELQEEGWLSALHNGIRITGGASNLPGIVELGEQVFGPEVPFERGRPRKIKGLVDVVENPRYAAGTGLVLVGIRQRHKAWFSNWSPRPKSKGFMGFFKGLFT